jgi:hypothetical protein
MAAESGGARSAAADKFWNATGVDPVAVSLGKETGYTLRAYRMSDTLPPDEEQETPESRDIDPGISDEPENPEANEEPSEADFADEEQVDVAPEEVPVFLTRKGSLMLFRTPAALVRYVQSSDDNDLAAIDEYGDLQEGIKTEYIVCDEADNYALDKVVANLRKGHAEWDAELLISAAEIGRDLSHALRLHSVVDSLAPGSPLDDLDEAMRAIVDGGLRAMFAKRKVRKLGVEQTAIAWRGVIGKITDVADWRNGKD